DKSLAVWVGVDASTKHDTTAVAAVTFDAQSKKVRLVAHRIFQPKPNAPLDFEATIEATVRDFAHRFSVRGVHYDPYQMGAFAQRLSALGLPRGKYAQSVPTLPAMGSNLYELIKPGGIIVYPDEVLRLAISRTIAWETPRVLRWAKKKTSHKIDIVI